MTYINNNNHIRVNIRPIFLSTLGTWDNQNRIYIKTLPSDDYRQCRETCNSFFSIEKQSDSNTNITQINKTTCNKYCEQLYNQYKDDSEAMIAARRYCIPGVETSAYQKCLDKNANNILKEIKKLCGTDETCLVNNKDIAYNMFTSKKIYSFGGKNKFANKEYFTNTQSGNVSI